MKKHLPWSTRTRSALLLIVATATVVAVTIGITSWKICSESFNPSLVENTTTAFGNDTVPGSNSRAQSSPSPSPTTAREPIPGTTIPSTLSAGMGFKGHNIPLCDCSFSEIEQVNAEVIQPLLRKIVQTPFFSHFKIDLCSSCELWEDAPLCRMKDCSVCECDQPPSWSFRNVPELPPTGPDCGGDADVGWSSVDTTFGSDPITGARFESLLLETEPEARNLLLGNNNAQVVDLIKNPEGYTGYDGASAEKVWSAVHSQNCFQPPGATQQAEPTTTIEDGNRHKDPGNKVDEGNGEEIGPYHNSLPPEQRLYNRLVSGMHSSISLHIAHSYCLELNPDRVGECSLWGLNDRLAYDRVLSHPQRVENLYAAFSLLLHAVIRAEDAIEAAVPVDDDPSWEDSRQLWRETLRPRLSSLSEDAPERIADDLCRVLVDETGRTERSELQRRFEELQSIVRCVGCDRCKLWGTLQTLGIGTALKILCRNEGSGTESESENGRLVLSRQEAVALVNTLERFSSSLVYAREFWIRREEAGGTGNNAVLFH